MNANFQMLEFPGVHKVNREIPKQKTQNKKGTREMKITMNRIKCEADRAYNKADDMHLMASCRQARKMAGKQACKMAGKRAFHIKDKDVLSAVPVRAPRFERFSQSVIF